MRLLGIVGSILQVEGLDILENMPLLDIKPYIPAFDARSRRSESAGAEARRVAPLRRMAGLRPAKHGRQTRMNSSSLRSRSCWRKAEMSAQAYACGVVTVRGLGDKCEAE